MDYLKYLEMIRMNPQEAKKYKNSFIPDTLFKYFKLTEDKTRNEKRFKTLASAELHLGTYDDYNDPFEGTFLLIDEKKLSEYGWPYGVVSQLYKNLVNGYKICSLADTDEQDMPMWAYYANGHKGFCVEYKLSPKQKDYIFPVSYEIKRQRATSLMANLVNDTIKVANNNPRANISDKLNLLDEDSSRANILIFLSIATKHESWKHEKEFRIIVPSTHNSFPAIPSRIYAGKNCDIECIERLTEITEEYQRKGFPVELYKMQFNPDDEYFQLAKEKLV